MKSRPTMLKDDAYIKLENMIVTGELEPGRWVSEAELVKETRLGRASVRSAIQRLADQQLMSVFPSKGAQICPIDFKQQFRALEMRRVIERFLVVTATKRGSSEQKTRFSELAAGFYEAAKNEDLVAMTETDRQNFALTQEAADNPFATHAILSIKGLSRRFWVHHLEEHGKVSSMAKVHGDTAAAMSGTDEVVAEKAVIALVEYVEKFTLSVVGYSSAKCD